MHSPFTQYPWLQDTYDLIVRSYKEGRAHHAYLLTHKGDIGQEILAEELYKFLLCRNNKDPQYHYACGHCRSCVALELKSNEDFYELGEVKDNGNVGIVSVEKVRAMAEGLNIPPGVSPNNVVYAPNASKLLKASSNAILKILEEPYDDTFFLLFNDKDLPILPTIRSRCFLKQISSPNKQQMLEFLAKNNIHDPEASLYLSISSDEPSLIMQMHRKDFISCYNQLVGACGLVANSLEIEAMVNAFNSKDYEVFMWQLEGLITLLEEVYKKGTLSPKSNLLPNAQEFINFFASKKINSDQLFQYITKLHFMHHQLRRFADQFGNDKTLEFVAHKIAAQFALFIYDLYEAEKK